MEKRRYRRVKSNFNVKLDPEPEETRASSSSLIGKSIDISASGILFTYNKKLELGNIIKVAFLKPNSFELFKARGKIVRTEINPDNKTYDIGIVFIDLDENDVEDLDYYVMDKE